MKALRITSALVCLLLGPTAFAQTKPDSLGLPGDNFDLYGALELFKKSATPEEFEKAINSNDNEVNNLDLDGDGKVDYVKVIDKQNGDAHTLVLQVDVSASEKQDVAVIEIEKTGNDKAHVQIVGDQELYGKNYIVEPTESKTEEKRDEKKVAKSSGSNLEGSNDDVYSTSDNSNRSAANANSSNDGSTGNTYVTNNNYYDNTNPNPTVVVNVWGWPSVRYIYGPSYAVWVSPWYWNTYPVWWSPWAPVYWRYHYRRSWRYHYPYYHRVPYYRSPGAHNWYYGRRMSSQTVRGHRESGFYTQKQMMYKNNVQPGRKYNSMPARQDGYQKQHMNQPQKMNNGVRQQNDLQSQPGVKQQQPVRQQNNGGWKQEQPVKQQQPVRQQQPMQQQQPIKQQQPIRQQMPQQQQPMKQQSMPRQNGGGMRNGGGGGGGVRNGGGAMHNGSGAMHRR